MFQIEEERPRIKGRQKSIRWAIKAFKYFKIVIIKLEHIPVKGYNTAPPRTSQEMRWLLCKAV